MAFPSHSITEKMTETLAKSGWNLSRGNVCLEGYSNFKEKINLPLASIRSLYYCHYGMFSCSTVLGSWSVLYLGAVWQTGNWIVVTVICSLSWLWSNFLLSTLLQVVVSTRDWGISVTGLTMLFGVVEDMEDFGLETQLEALSVAQLAILVGTWTSVLRGI